MWANPLNWADGTMPTNTDDVTFGGTIVGSATITLPVGAEASALLFNNAYTLSGGTLALGRPTFTQGSILMGGPPAAVGTINTTLVGGKGLLISHNGTLLLTGNNTFSGPINVGGSSGAVRITSDANLGDISNACGSYGIIEADATFTSMRTYTLGTSQAGFSVTGANLFTIGTALNIGGVMAKKGTGTLILTQPASGMFAGGIDTDVNDGVLRLEHADALGTTHFNGIEVQTNGTLELANLTFARKVTLQGGRVRGSGNTLLAGGLQLDAFDNSRINSGTSAGDVLTVGDAVNELTGGFGRTATIEGAGTVIFNHSSTNSAVWKVTSGTLLLNHAQALGTGTAAVTVTNAALGLGFGSFTRNLNVANATLYSVGTTAQLSGSITPGGATTLATTVALTAPGAASGNDMSISGQLFLPRLAVTNTSGVPAALTLTNTTNSFGNGITIDQDAELISKPTTKTGHTLTGNTFLTLRGGTVSFLSNSDLSLALGWLSAGTGIGIEPARTSRLFYDRYDAGGAGHTLIVPVIVATNQTLETEAGHDYTIQTHYLNSRGTLEHQGGDLRISGFQSHQVASKLIVNAGTVTIDVDTSGGSGPNLMLEANAGVTTLNSTQKLASISVAAGAVVTMSADGNRALHTGALSVIGSGNLDLNDNDLVVNNESFSVIQGLVLLGFGNPAGPGITSSTSDGSQILALFDNALVGAGDWNGVPIGANAVVGKYTYFGDVNIDGQVTGDDYTVIDANLNTTPPVGLGWLSGDANLDGIVTGDDYTVIDANLGLGNGNPLTPSQSTNPVPEPAAVALVAAGLLTARRRRRDGQVTGDDYTVIDTNLNTTHAVGPEQDK
jgi:MYXO-CTERM domain-containing protein